MTSLEKRVPGRRPDLLWTLGVAALLSLGVRAEAQIGASGLCTVSVLNRSATVRPDGSWLVTNIPAGTGPVRARMTCIDEGQTLTAASDSFEVLRDRMHGIPPITLGGGRPTPARLSVLPPAARLTSAGETVQLAVSAILADGTAADVTPASAGTLYGSTNARVATVSPDGSVTGLASGRVLVTVMHEALLAAVAVEVVLAGDSDGDGLPDDFELANGLDPNNPVDALDDPDEDGLSTLDEFQAGLDPFDPDSDGDGLLDGEEADTRGTNPLLADTDGDGLGDGLEVATGSDPLDPASFNLVAALASIEVAPPAFRLIFNTVLGEASRKLTVTGHLVDGGRLDLTHPRYGTVFQSSDLTVANFGAEPGRVYAGRAGQATITAEAGGRAASAQALVEVFTPRALAFLSVPGFANAVAVEGDFAFVAAGATGLQVVDVSDLEAPFLAGAVDTPGNANDVVVREGLAYVADGSAGLVVIDVSVPQAPEILGRAFAVGQATAVEVRDGLAYVADEEGLAIFDVSDPAAPSLVAAAQARGRARGVALLGSFAYVAVRERGVEVFDVSDPASPVRVTTMATRPTTSHVGGPNAADVAVRDGLAVAADGAQQSLGGLRLLDVREPASPVIAAAGGDNIGITAVELEGGLAFGADFFFSGDVPIYDLRSGRPVLTAVVDFFAFSGRSDNGAGLAVRRGEVYLAANKTTRDNGVTGDGGLYIGRYALFTEEGGEPPAVAITEPEGPVEERRGVVVRADARDDVRVDAVQFLVQGQLACTDFGAPYECPITVPEGAAELRLRARVFDGAGNESLAEERVVEVEPNARAEAVLLAPRPGDTVVEGAAFTVAASASDDQAVVRVEFLVNGALGGTDGEAPYRFEAVAPVGASSVSVSAVAYDELGSSEPAGPVAVTVTPDQPPTAVVLAPVGGEEIVEGSVFTLVAGAADDVDLQSVRFLIEGEVVGSVGSPPFIWPVTAPAAGTTLRLGVVVRDSRLQETASPEVTVVTVPDPLTALRGRTVDELGAPVAGARVEIFPGDGLAFSGPDGGFLVEGLPTNEGDFSVSASATVGGFTLSAGLEEPVPPQPGRVVELGEVVLLRDDPGTTVLGTVVDELGAPVAGATVKVYDSFTVLTTASAADGRFAVTDAPTEEPLFLTALAEVDGAQLRGTAIVEPVAGEVSDAGEVVLFPLPDEPDPLTTVVGLVVDPFGEPVPGARVNVFTSFDVFPTLTAAEGTFEVPGVPTVDGFLSASAAAVIEGILLTGNSDSLAPEPGGITDLGTIELTEEGPGPVKSAPTRTRQGSASVQPLPQWRLPPAWSPADLASASLVSIARAVGTEGPPEVAASPAWDLGLASGGPIGAPGAGTSPQR